MRDWFKRMGQVDEKLLSYARELDRHYIPSRYPNAYPDGTPHEAYGEEAASRALRAAEALVEFARRLLKCEGEQKAA